MKLRAFTKALQYAFLPTASILLLLFFAFFDVSKTINFITSNSGVAIALRVIAFIAEATLVTIFYFRNLKELSIKEGKNFNRSDTFLRDCYSSDAKHYFTNGTSQDDYSLHKTDHPNVVVIVRKPKSEF